MRKLFSFILFCALLFPCVSCTHVDAPAGNGAASTDTTAAEETTNAQQKEEFSQTTFAIEIVDYLDPFAVSAYNDLTDDQKIAYEAIGAMLQDICDNGPKSGKQYSLEKRVSFYDFATALNIYKANYTALSDILLNVFCSENATNSVDSLFLFDDGHWDQYLKEYGEVSAAADEILASLRYDGTEYDLAYTIASWMVDNIVYPDDYEERVSDPLHTAYSALINREATCGGYASAYDLLCKKAGLETIWVGDITIDSAHAWNMIRIDEKWYHVDVTWMNKEEPYAYFLMPDEVCYRDHFTPPYYIVQETNEKVVPVADTYCMYEFVREGRVFEDADAALLYTQSLEERARMGLWFTSTDERDKFLLYNHTYMKNLKCYMYAEAVGDNIVQVTFEY